MQKDQVPILWMRKLRLRGRGSRGLGRAHYGPSMCSPLLVGRLNEIQP